jgi:predicted AAA+ superfamily ATPase
MPHFRSRYLEPILKKDLTWSPVVSVLGMRQVGKSTLLKTMGKTYLTLDDDTLRNKWETGDWASLEGSARPIVIDEAQKLPGVFERVKLLVDQERRPGQYLLTGSVRFLSRKEIRESLTGRTSILELLPLSVREAHSQKLASFFKKLEKRPVEGFKKENQTGQLLSKAQVEHYLLHGGMPGICFKRDQSVQRQMREAHLETVLLRDLQLLVRTRVPYEKLRSLLQLIAQTQGLPLSMTQLGRQVQISTPTVIQLLQAFVDLFIIKPHGKAWYFTDCGMASFLGGNKVENRLFQMERWIYSELRAQLNYSYRASFEFSSYSTRGGARLPFVVHLEDFGTIAIAVDASQGASEKSLKSLTSFQKAQKKRVRSVVLHDGTECYQSSTGAICIPFEWIA